MAVGVNNRPSTPNGPLRDNNKNTIRPTTTGGRPINVFNINTKKLRPLNLLRASEAPKGNPIIQDIKTALILTFKDMAIIPIRSLSKLMMSSIACDRPSEKVAMKLIQ
jgi:hypothetical protein